MDRYRVVLLTPLPRRVRVKLAVAHARDGVGIWLTRHGQWRIAMYWWQITGAW